MKLAIVTALPPSKVTLNEYGFHLAKHFAQKEEIEELILITDKVREPRHFDFDTGKVTLIEAWKFNSYNTLFSVSKAIRKSGADAVLFNLQFMKFGDKKVPAALGLMLPMMCRFQGIPSITLLHNILEQVDLGQAGFTENRILKFLFNQIGTFLTRLILQSDRVALTIGKYVEIISAKYQAKNVILMPHGSFETPPAPDFDIPEGPKKVMCFGKFGTYKRVELMIEAVEELRQRTNLDLEIVIAGTDSPNTPGYLQEMKEKYAMVQNIEFTGYVAEEEVPKVFTESAVVVFPYTATTGSSGVLHQAGSYGKAVVMPNLGDLALLVEEEGYAGEFFEPGNVASLARSLENILKNEEYRRSLGEKNYAAACSLPMETIAQMYLEEFKSLRKQKLKIKYV